MGRQARSRNRTPSVQSETSRNSQTGLAWPTDLNERDKRKIDAAFRPMANDVAYHREAVQLVKDFSASDAECSVLWVCRRRIKIGSGAKQGKLGMRQTIEVCGKREGLGSR